MFSFFIRKYWEHGASSNHTRKKIRAKLHPKDFFHPEQNPARLLRLTGSGDKTSFKIQERVKDFFNQGNDSFVKDVFTRYMDQFKNIIALGVLPDALRDLGIRLTLDEITRLVETSDIDEKGGLNLQEFMKAINYQCKVEQWVASLPLPKLLAHCLDFRDSEDPLREVSRLSTDELNASTEAYCKNLSKILSNALCALKQCYAAMDTIAAGDDKTGSKFQTFRMSAGNVGDFHKGLIGRVGESSEPSPVLCLQITPEFRRCPASKPVQGNGGGALCQGRLQR